MLVYANDFDGSPPFTARGVNPSDPREEDGLSAEERARVNVEDWLTKNVSYICGKEEDIWPAGVAAAGYTWFDEYVPRSGSLFEYTRFPDLYRCPEFARVTQASQRAFNFTRTCLGRKWILPPPLEHPTPEEEGGFAGGMGAIVKVSQVYSPASLQLIADESWQFHVAEPEFFQGRMEGMWECSDPIYWFGQSEIGQYHGQPVMGLVSPPFADEPEPSEAVKRGNIAHYDGHVDLVRDFMPGRNFLSALISDASLLDPIANFILGQIFYQRGLNPDISILLP
jgi:hypothetical protein